MNILRCLSLTTLSLIATASILSPAMADVHQQDTTAITAAIAAADTATEKEDAQAANAALAEDYVSYDANKQ
jgi:hypothetical protein